MTDRKRTRSPSPGPEDDQEMMRIMPIGAGNEVGRSCVILKYMGKTIMLDCGIHPGYNGIAALPFFDAIDPSEIDLVLVTHFHLDHAASLPYLTEKTGFKGRIFCTHPTKAVMRMLLADYIRLVNVHTEDILYDEKDLNRCIDKIELIDYHQVLEHEGMKFWCYNAGHVLGAAMFMIEIAMIGSYSIDRYPKSNTLLLLGPALGGGVHVLYTGDYSMEDDRHLMAAEMPSTSPDVLIVEATYGVQVHSPREERETRFVGTVSKTVKRGGRCLIPVFALGRAQELLLILDEYWQQHRELHHIPIYYASRLASKAIRVYQTYINMMNEHIRQQMDVANPFKFQHITNLKSIEHFEDSGPSVVMASPGMLQSGVSRMLFDRWCTDEKNSVLIPGYSVEGTLAKKIQSSPDEVTGMDGRVRHLNCAVEYISFSAHVDFVQNKSFIDGVEPANVILVHGEEVGMGRLKASLEKQFAVIPKDERPLVFNPKNCVEVQIEFHREKVAKAVGSLARELGAGRERGVARRKEALDLQGLLVNERFTKRLMAPDDLNEYTLLKVGGVRQRVTVPYFSSKDVLRDFVGEVFADESVAEEEGDFGTRFLVHGSVAATLPSSGPTRTKLLLEWDASPVNDMLADCIAALAAQAQTSPVGISLTTGEHHHHHHRYHHGGHHDRKSSTREQNQAAAEAGDDRSRTVGDKNTDEPSAISSSSSPSPSSKNTSEDSNKSKSSQDGGKPDLVDTAEAGASSEKPGEKSMESDERVAEGSKVEVDAGKVQQRQESLSGEDGAVKQEAVDEKREAEQADADASGDPPRGSPQEEGLKADDEGVSKEEEACEDPEDSMAAIMAVALLLIRHALEDTFGKGSLTMDESRGEVTLVTDRARLRLRVVVSPPPSRSPSPSQTQRADGAGAEVDSLEGSEAAWRCEVLECSKDGAEYDSLRSQVCVLIERLRIAVSKS